MKRFTILVFLFLTIISGIAFAEEVVTNPPTPPAAEQASPAQPAPEAAVAAEPAKIDTGDTAWMIVATALVMLMTLPGLALFYGGLAKRKDTLNTMAMSFVTYCIVSILWVVYGYTLVFGTDIKGIIGGTEKLMLAGVEFNSL
jgi:Amt family ammonium transporter